MTTPTKTPTKMTRVTTAFGTYAHDDAGTLHVWNEQRGWVRIETYFHPYIAARKPAIAHRVRRAAAQRAAGLS